MLIGKLCLQKSLNPENPEQVPAEAPLFTGQTRAQNELTLTLWNSWASRNCKSWNLYFTISEWFLSDFWMIQGWDFRQGVIGACDFWVIFLWFLNGFAWWSGFSVILEWFCFSIFFWFWMIFCDLMEWFLSDFWVILCDGMVFQWFLSDFFVILCDGVLLEWFLSDFVWWSGFSVIFFVIFEWFFCDFVWWSGFSVIFLRFLSDFFVILCDGVVLEWFLNDFWMILCDGVVFQWFFVILCDGMVFQWFCVISYPKNPKQNPKKIPNKSLTQILIPEKMQPPILKISLKNAENNYFTTLRICWSEIYNANQNARWFTCVTFWWFPYSWRVTISPTIPQKNGYKEIAYQLLPSDLLIP